MNFQRSNVKHRLRQYVADLWGYQQADMDGFDPIVDLLLGACAVEFERTGNQIISSQGRVLEKLAQLLLPESLTIPQPAHAVIQAQSVEASYFLKSEDQFSLDKEVINPAKPTEISTQSIYFSPTMPLPLFDASIRYVASGNKLMEQVDANLRENVALTTKGERLSNQTIWLGIKVSPELINMPALSFFFDWRNDPEKQRYFNLLPVTKFSIDGQNLPLKSGYHEAVENKVARQRNTLVNEWDFLPKIESNVNQLYQHHFLSLKETKTPIKKLLKTYPEAFLALFSAEDLKNLKDTLLWLKIDMSQLIPQQAVEEMYCALNCFPACNRQLIDNRRPYRLDQHLNIIPLKTEDFFLTIHRVASGDGQAFRAIPFFNLNQMEAGTYAIRKSRVGRFDSRNAREMLQYVLELMRDEGAAFAALGGSIGSKEIEELEQNLNKIENSLLRKSTDPDIHQYLMLQPGKARDVYVSYWSTAGAVGNQIPAGNTLSTRTIDIKSGKALTITTSYGGKDKPSEQEKLYAFRSSLLSRDRIVTKEDIRAACFAELGQAIQAVEVKKGYQNEPDSRQGLKRVIDVFLTPADGQVMDKAAWETICHELALRLEQRTSLFLPIHVKVASLAVETHG